MEVHKELGCGFQEAVYHEALEKEFGTQNIPFTSQPVVKLSYKGKVLRKTYQPDFICFNGILVEIKALSYVSGAEEAQILNYLKATGLEIGLLLNFGGKSLEYKRFINTPTRDDQVGNSREFGNPGNRQSAECMDGESAESVDRKSAESVDRFEKWEFPEIEEGKPTKYNWVVQHKDNLKLGYKTDIGAFSYINAEYGVIIEDLVQIGSHCSIYSISTIDKKQGKVRLRKNCKIGSHSVVMPGGTVGENSIVGAFSFVNSNTYTR
jgi:GxxExxY protein